MYALASLGLRRFAGRFCVAGAALGALQGGRMYALASFGLRHSALLRSCPSEAGHGDVSTQLLLVSLSWLLYS